MTTFFKSAEDAQKERKWLLVDATNIPVGRLATKVATLLKGKHKPDYTPHVDGGDFVIVINASKVVFTGKKAERKLYRHHTNFIGGLKEEPAGELLARKPEEVIRLAVIGMLADGVQTHGLMTKLKVFADDKHPHGVQKPEVYKIAA